MQPIILNLKSNKGSDIKRLRKFLAKTKTVVKLSKINTKNPLVGIYNAFQNNTRHFTK